MEGPKIRVVVKDQKMYSTHVYVGDEELFNVVSVSVEINGDNPHPQTTLVLENVEWETVDSDA